MALESKGKGVHQSSRLLLLVFVTNVDFLPESLMLSICLFLTRLKKLGSFCPTYLEGLNITRAQEQALSISTRRTVPRVQEQAPSSAWVGRTLLPPGGQS